MKLEALDHPKTLDLASRLNVELPTAIGYLELLWAFTGKKAPQGNIGKWPDGAIARACYWMGQPDTFVGALRDSGFLDANSEHRLAVHDWQEHAPRWVKAKLVSMGVGFVETIEPPIGPPTVGAIEPPIGPPSKGREVKPREVKGERRVTAPGLASRIPDDFALTPERRAVAVTEAIDPERTFAGFLDHWRSKGGTAARKTDWDATWRNWCRREADFKGKSGKGAFKTSEQAAAEKFLRGEL